MKRTAALIAVLVMLAAMGSASAQPPLPAPRAANPPIMVAAATNNDFLNAWVFYPNVRLSVSGIETATVEAGEPAHTCGAGGPVAGSNSVWFATYLPDGELTLKTEGTAYVTAGSGTLDDSIISLYRLKGNESVVDFSFLEQVDCGSGGSGPGQIKQTIIEGTYLVQLSMEAAETVTGGTAALLAKFVPMNSIASDSIATARALTFPKSYSLAMAQFATVDLNEPVDLLYPANTQVQNSVWFKFSLTRTMGLMIQGGLLGGIQSVSIFKAEPDGSLTSIPYNYSTSLFVALAQFAPGNYYLRLAGIVEQLAIQELDQYNNFFASILLATVSLTPTNFELGTNEGTPGAAASLEGWTVKNAGAGDTSMCVANVCGYQITSSGTDESTVLMSKMKLSSVYVRKGEMMQMGIYGDHSGEGRVRITVDLIDAAGTVVRISREFYLGSDDYTVSFEAVPGKINPVKSTVKIENLSDTPGDSIFIDKVIVVPIRLGPPLPRSDQR